MNKMNTKYIILSFMIVGMLVSVATLIPKDLKNEEITPKNPQWNSIQDAALGSSSGGFLRIVIKELNWTGDSSTFLNSNNSLSTNLSDISADAFSEDIPHSTPIGIYVVARFNATQAYSVGNSTWVTAWTRCRITSADLNIAADTICNKTVFDTAGTTYLYVCFYLEMNASSMPIKINRDTANTISSIKIEAYY